MYNVLLIATSRSRTKYFNHIKEHLKLHISIESNPISFNIANYFKAKKNTNFDTIFQEKFREIETKYSNTLYKKIYKTFIKIIAPAIASAYYQLLKKHPTTIMGLWNGKKFPEMIATQVAKNLNVQTFYFENGLFPNTTVIDTQGVNATNSVPREISFYKNYNDLTPLPQELIQRKTLGKRIENAIELPQNYIFIPFQTNFDTQVVYHGRWIKNMEQLFNIMNNLSQTLKMNFILKEHPSERQMDYTHLHEQAKQNPYLNFANAINTQELIQKSSAIITINSSVGLESLLFNKKVIVLGEAFYDIAGITKSAQSEQELSNILKILEEWEVDEENIKKFLSYLLNDYLIHGNWKNPDTQHFQELEKRFKKIIDESPHNL